MSAGEVDAMEFPELPSLSDPRLDALAAMVSERREQAERAEEDDWARVALAKEFPLVDVGLRALEALDDLERLLARMPASTLPGDKPHTLADLFAEYGRAIRLAVTCEIEIRSSAVIERVGSLAPVLGDRRTGRIVYRRWP